MKETVLKRSRKSFAISYVFALVFALIILFVYIIEIFPLFAIYLLSFPAVYLFLLPEYIKISSKYLIKDESIEEIVGIVTKKKNIVTWNLVTGVSMNKGVLGTMLNYGDITVNSMAGERNNIVIRGINGPEKVLRQIEKKIGKRFME